MSSLERVNLELKPSYKRRRNRLTVLVTANYLLLTANLYCEGSRWTPNDAIV